MPAIHLFGRRTFLGGDDLQLPCLLAMTLRVIQLTAFLIPIWWHIRRESRQHGSLWNYIWYDPNDFDCRRSHMMPLLLSIYACLSTLVAFVSLVAEARLYRASGLGCPIDTQPRSKKVENLLEFKLVPVGIIQCLVLLLGVVTVCFAKTHYNCLKGRVGYDYTQDDDFWRYVTADGDEANQDPSLLWWIAYTLLWVSQLVEVVATILTWLQFCSSISDSLVQPLHHELVEELWVERCTSACECIGRSTCFLFGGRNMDIGNYGDVARALTDFMEGDLDLVPSDIVMGLMILQKIQRQRVLEARTEIQIESEHLIRSQQSNDSSDAHSVAPNSSLAPNSKRQSFYVMHQEGSQTFYESTSRRVLNVIKPLDRAVLQEGARFSRYQLAIYTWVLYLYGNPVTGLPRLLTKSGCGCCAETSQHGEDQEMLMNDIPSDLVVGDNWCKIHKAALMLQAGIDDTTELIYAQLHNSFSEIPYCIIVDHAWKCVVLAIRGTFSLEDCVQDVMLDPTSLAEMGDEFGFDGSDQHCHGGIVTCARVVYRDLERHGLLDKLLLGDMAKYPDYTLRIVGHSLGAGTASLMSYMLKRKFPTLRCINYSPPGCSFTWRMATECKDWCTAFVLDSDLVPRLSLNALEHLRDEVVDLVGRVKVPKSEVATRTFPVSGFVCRDSGRNSDVDALADLVDTLVNDDDEVNASSDYQMRLESFRSIQEERRSHRGLARSILMYPPGRMVHFMKTGEITNWKTGIVKCVTCCTTNIGAQYTPIWVKNDDFNEIVVSPTMGTDHFPNRLTDTLQNLADKCGLDTTRLCNFEDVEEVGLPI